MNPLLADWTTPHALPPFDAIDDSHFAEAFEIAITEARDNAAAIGAATDPATFENTIEALERSDRLLDRVANVFFNLAAADSNDAREALQRDLSPKLAALHSEIVMNADLFARVRAVRDGNATLSAEQQRVLDLTHKMFVRSGAELDGEKRDRFKTVMERLAELGTAFSQNVLADEREWKMNLGADDLGGLSDELCAAAKSAAEERGQDGYVITLSRSLIAPFLQYSTRRDLRETAFKAWTARGANGNETDNTAIVTETLRLRQERAELLGYENFARFKLENQMAKTPDAVRDLLMAVWSPAKAQAEADAETLTAMMHDDGINGDLEPWDWRFYAERRRRAEHDLDDAELKPFLQLDRMIDAAFSVATRLFGLSFRELQVPLYHPDARAWEVRQGDRHMGVFIGDYFARPSKRSGAWCSSFRSQSRLDDDIRPIAVNVCNFAKAPDGAATLLTFDDAETLFHEFGHALHVLNSDVTYPSISGTSVARDFVELPSQLYEHWLSVPDVLREFAVHAETGAPIPQDLVDKLRAARNFDQGFSTVEYTSSALVDLDFHTNPAPDDPISAEAATLNRIGMPRAIVMRHATPHFAHVFSGDGYSCGYYSYMWSEVMDADAFKAFEETGDPFDTATAARLKEHIYAAGGSQDAEALYLAFRGRMPDVAALLEQRGLG